MSPTKSKSKGLLNFVPVMTFNEYYEFVVPSTIVFIISLILLPLVFLKKRQLKDKF